MLGVCALSKTYLEQLAVDELISRTSFRAPTLNPITALGVLPHGAATRAAIALQRAAAELGGLQPKLLALIPPQVANQ